MFHIDRGRGTKNEKKSATKHTHIRTAYQKKAHNTTQQHKTKKEKSEKSNTRAQHSGKK